MVMVPVLKAVASAVLIGTALVGCASSAKSDESKAAAAGNAMMCPTCETVWVPRLTGQGTKIQRMVSEKNMTCPECDAMAAAYIEDGKMVLHDCPTCKVAPRPLTPAPPLTHPKGTH